MLKWILIFMALGQLSMAATQEDYKFRFNYESKILELSVKAKSSTSAFEVAANECFNHFAHSTGQARVKLPESKGLAIIDACANPRAL